MLFVARTAIAFQFQSIPALSPLLVESLRIDYALLGTLVGLYMLPGVVFSLPGGVLGQRFGDKQIALVGLGLMALGGLWVALSGTYLSASFGRVVSGVGAVLLNIVLAKMVTDWFAGREIVTAMALFVGGWPIGLALALTMLPITASAFSTDVALSTTAALCAVGLVLIATLYRPPPGVAQASGGFRLELSRQEWLLSFLAGMVWALYNVGFITVLAFGPSFLIARGLPLTLAAAIVSVVTWTCLLSNLIGGYLAERLGSRDVTMIMCLIAVALLLGGLTLGASPVLICLALGLLIGPPAGLIMALPGEAVRTQNRTAAMGVYYTCFYAAMAGLVPVAGHLRDAFGAAAPLIFGATMMLTACVSLVCFRVVQRRTRGVSPAVTSAGA